MRSTRSIYLIQLTILLLLALQSVAQVEGSREPSKGETRNGAPREMRDSERPRDTRARNLAAARLRVMRNYDEVLRRVERLQPEVDKNNAEVDADFQAKLLTAAEQSRKNREPFTWNSRRALEVARDARYRSAFNEVYYGLLQRAVMGMGAACEPDVDTVSRSTIWPGGATLLEGTCFGPSQGKVLLEIAPERVIEMEVTSWTETRVLARVNPIVAEVPLRRHYGKVWLQTGNGVTSNVWPIMYHPIYGWYLASWTRREFGGVWGYSDDSIFLENRMLGDSDFTIERVEIHHWGDGWSQLQAPNAAGQSMGQGYHIGVGALKHANMSLTYRVYGPKGIYPPVVEELGPWGYLGDDYW